MSTPQEFKNALRDYFLARLGDVSEIEITRVERVPGGASRETWSIDVEWVESNGKRRTQGFILRRDPESSPVRTNRALEFLFYESFQDSAVPVPRVFWFEKEGGPLERPFFVLERIDDCQSQFQALGQPSFARFRARLGRRMYEILAEIAKTPIEDLPARRLAEVPPADQCGQRELDNWEKVIDENDIEPQPIARAALRWLRANPPPPAQRVAVVHGDYRTGNFLYRQDQILGILDWEMAHFGDPLEDLAWSFLPVWQWAKDGKVGGLIERDEALQIWQEHSGLRAEPQALHWWEVFSTVKAQAIWLSGAREYSEGRSTDPILAFTSYWLINAHDRFILEALGRL